LVVSTAAAEQVSKFLVRRGGGRRRRFTLRCRVQCRVGGDLLFLDGYCRPLGRIVGVVVAVTRQPADLFDQ